MVQLNSVKMNQDLSTGIKYRQWIARDSAGVVVLVHGLGAHSARWQSLGEFFVLKNISCYAIELKGFGETEEKEGHVDSFAVYYQDIETLFKIVQKKHGQEKVYLLGESLGGLISFLMVAQKPQLFDGLICFSPAFKGTLKFPLWYYGLMPLALVFRPQKQFNLPFNSSMCTRDNDYSNQMDKDIREVRVASAKMLWNILLAQLGVRRAIKRVSCPVLILLSGNDQLVNNETTQKVFSLLPGEDKALQIYDKMYHALSIDLEREKVFSDIVKWISQHV